MPTYISRNLQDYPTEFYKCPANPSGFEFTCIFCYNFYKTKRACIAHMKKCCIDKDMEYDDGFTVNDYHHNHAAKLITIKNYIKNNALASLSNISSSQIIEQIQAKLIENGFNSVGFYLYTTSFTIYRFFFIVSDEDKSNYHDKITQKIFGYG